MSRAPDPVLPDAGLPAQIAGYRLDGYLGQGSMAAVYLAWDKRADRQVALKVLAPELARDAAFRARVLRESPAAAALGHPHIIPVYQAGEVGGTVYVAMRYIEGGDARSRLNRLGPLPPGPAWNVIAQVAGALDAAHGNGLIHRDVKPANILLEATGTAAGAAQLAGDDETGQAYLSDFGMSRDFSPAEIIATGQFAGSLDYAAPEQLEDGGAVDGRADLYALACAGFELLCGTPPFGQDQGLTVMYAQLYAPPPAATGRRPDLPAAVDQVLATALAKDPADRYPSCGQFAEELRVALGLRPGAAQRPPRPRPPADAAAAGLAAAAGPAGPAARGRAGRACRAVPPGASRRPGIHRTAAGGPRPAQPGPGEFRPTPWPGDWPGRTGSTAVPAGPRRAEARRRRRRGRRRRGGRGRHRRCPVEAAISGPASRVHTHVSALRLRRVLAAVSVSVAVAVRPGRPAGGRDQHPAGFERRHPHGAAGRRGPGSGLREPARRSQPAAGRRESARH